LLHPLEVEALKEVASSAGADVKRLEKIIDHRLSFDQNKRVVKDWLKAEGKAVDMRSEMVADKELSEKMIGALQTELGEKEAIKYNQVISKKADIDAKISAMQ